MIRFHTFLALMTSRRDARSSLLDLGRHRFFQRAAAPVAALALLIAMVALSRDFGATWDERALQKLGEQLWDFYNGRMSRQDIVTGVDQSFGHNLIYGVFVDFVSVAAQHVIRDDLWVVRHYVNAVFGWLGVVVAFLMASRLFGRRAGWLAALLLITMPRYFAESMNNPKDLPFAVLMLAAFYFIVTIAPRAPFVTWPRVVALGSVIALALNVRSMGLVLLGYSGIALTVAVAASRDWSTRALATATVRMAAITLIALLGSGAFWPWAQESPLTRPFEAFFTASGFNWGNPSLFMGRSLGPADLPWYYLPTWIGITVPVGVLLGLLLSVPRLVRLSASRVPLAALWLFVLVPSTYVIVRHLTLYDGIRHVFFIVPPMAVIAAGGWDYMLRAADGRRQALVAIALAAVIAEPVLFQIRNHPNQAVYFTPAIGGPQAAFGRYDMDYWGNCVLEASAWAAEQADRAGMAIGVAANAWEILAMDIGRFRQLFFRRMHHTGYHLDVRLLKGTPPDIMWTASHPDVVHNVSTADGTPLCVVLRGPEYPELERRLAEAASTQAAGARLRR
jgi:hypothetical protein